MHTSYDDIVSRIKDPIIWWDENGTPRFDQFHPKYCPSIYADTVILLHIQCQACQKDFNVEMHSHSFDRISSQLPKKWHYGDPPIHGCTGDTMNCDDVNVLEVWQRHRGDLKDREYFVWKRRNDLEGPVDEPS